MRLLVALDMKGRTVAVVGAGRVGMRKARKMAACGARLRIIDPAASEWAGHDVCARVFEPGDLDGCDLAIACTGVESVDQKVAEEARERGIWCNLAVGGGDIDLVATYRHGAVAIGVHAGGNPSRAVAIRDHLSEVARELTEATEDPAQSQSNTQRPIYILAGFGPFPGVPENPTQSIAREAAGRLAHLDVQVVDLPTVFEEAWPTLLHSIQQHQDRLAAVFVLGVASKRDHIDVETVAFNRQCTDRPDASGKPASSQKIIVGGPAACEVRFDAQALVTSLRQGGHQIRTSCDAGDYLCNQVFYRTLIWQRQTGFAGGAGFVHVPPPSSLSAGSSADAIAGLLDLISAATPDTADV